jgi:hypothetical protein
MSFTFDTTIPAAANNPSNDQPGMLQNNVSTNSLISVDHITFNTANGGQHKQITFNNKNVPAAQTDPQSVLYTNNVIAATYNTASASTVSELFFRNQNAGGGNNSLPVSMIKAFGAFDNAGASLNTWNLVLKAVGGHPSAGNYTFNMPAGAVTGTSYLVFATAQAQFGGGVAQLACAYSIASDTEFNIQWAFPGVTTPKDPAQFSILIMQL